MNHPYISNLNAKERYNKMLNDAETHRRVRRMSGERPSFFKTLFSRIGKLGKTPVKHVAISSKVRHAS